MNLPTKRSFKNNEFNKNEFLFLKYLENLASKKTKNSFRDFDLLRR